jgi:hypothetical protein
MNGHNVNKQRSRPRDFSEYKRQYSQQSKADSGPFKPKRRAPEPSNEIKVKITSLVMLAVMV